jgi:hypothetical protein
MLVYIVMTKCGEDTDIWSVTSNADVAKRDELEAKKIYGEGTRVTVRAYGVEE